MARKSKTVTKTFRLNEELLEKANEYVAWYEKVYDEKITLTSLLEKGIKLSMWNTLENWMTQEEDSFVYDPNGDPNTGYMKKSSSELAKETHQLARYTYTSLYPEGDFIDQAEYYRLKRDIDVDHWIALSEFTEHWKEDYFDKQVEKYLAEQESRK